MSSSEKKRPSLTEHHDDQIVDNNRNLKSPNDIPIEKIHTANDWEHADLGDEQRKQKFLRLMGVKKRKDDNELNTKESHRISSDDDLSLEKKHCRSKVEIDSINLELEKQFNEGLQTKILHTNHEGLGFHHQSNSTTSTDCQDIKTNFVPATASSNQ